VGQDLKLKSKIQDVVVQDKRPDTLQANNGPAVDDLIVIRLEEVVAKAAQVRDVERSVMEAVVAEMAAMAAMVAEAVKALPLPEGPRWINMTVEVRVRTF
jgi:hypothetical protein